MKQYIVDAFTDKIFSGNQAAVCVMSYWPSEELMMNIARENNFSETAFIIKEHGGIYHLRWFTPGGEIDLCGHATLASAYVLMRFYGGIDIVTFETLGGVLTVTRQEDLYTMDFPVYELEPVAVTEEIANALGNIPVEAYMGRDLVCILNDEEQVKQCVPDMEQLRCLDGLMVHITASGREYDCVSRSFAPKLGIQEDPVCGSGHCHIMPYWSRVLGKEEIVAYQASRRGGELYGRIMGKRVMISGKAALYSQAEILEDVLN